MNNYWALFWRFIDLCICFKYESINNPNPHQSWTLTISLFMRLSVPLQLSSINTRTDMAQTQLILTLCPPSVIQTCPILQERIFDLGAGQKGWGPLLISPIQFFTPQESNKNMYKIVQPLSKTINFLKGMWDSEISHYLLINVIISWPTAVLCGYPAAQRRIWRPSIVD